MTAVEIGEREFTAVTEGYGLPPRLYLSQELFEAERKEIFGKAWQFAIHEDRVAAPGSYAVARLGEFEVIVARDAEGQVHAMRNVCLHRGARVVGCAGQGKVLRCPYHSWSYELDGRLRAAPGFEGDSRVTPGRSRLTRARADRLGPLLFVSLDPFGIELSEVLAPLGDFGDSLRGLVYAETREYAYACNWKVAIENSVECYHCPSIHPGFNSLIDVQNYVYDLHRFCAVAGGRRRSAAPRATTYEAATEDDGRSEVQTFYVWPNLWLLTYPGPSNLVAARWLPVGVDRTVCVREFYFGADFTVEKRPEFIAYVEEIQQQDIGICEEVYYNIRTGAFERSLLRFAASGTSEHGIRHFQELVLDALSRTSSPLQA